MLDNEVTIGWWRQFAQGAQGSQTDVIRIPFSLLVSNFGIGASTNGYTGGVFGRGKLYFSTLEVSSTPTTAYKLYKWNIVSSSSGTFGAAVYETQTQLFSKKQAIKEVRIYGEPWVANNSFTIALIGSDGSAITNSSKTFATSDSSLTVGDDFACYNPAIKPTYSL